MNPKFNYSWAEPADESEIQNFNQRNFGPQSIQADAARCHWLYFDNPLGLHISLCRADGELVAVCGHLPQRVQIGPELVTAGFGIDFMVANEWRRQGIGRHFLEMRLDRFALSLSFGQSREMGALYQSFGGLNLGQIRMGIFRKRPSLSVNLKKTLRDGFAWTRGMRGQKLPLETEMVPGRMTSAADFSSQEDWFKWRYEGGVYWDYECQELRSGNRPRGFAVCREENGLNTIVDLQVPLADRALLLAACARKTPNTESRFLFAGDRLMADCHQAGFLVRPHDAFLIAMTSHSHLRTLLKPGALDFTSGVGDADLLRHPSCL